ncbi:WRC domain-containing protein/QLQ domain-containing protein [Cephalotus follicularis]|uniref:Growth-regulating factor n=1 Tax=Cephalotus follicularis TaxID=3775 RepID=A0A1Q3CHP7_CEPFO|nr:WRC domain-containing protein/QLQ domain-containing protein [Cephalotus follicularis]
MDSHNLPLGIACFAHPGTNGVRSWDDYCNSEGNGSPPIGLGLELGRGSIPRSSCRRESSSGFTIFQLQELQLQSLIYRYMEAGVPVPYHLIAPIWKSFASSLSALNSGPNQIYSSYLGSGALNLDYSNGMDPEPGRCRRTDGKKWRCSKEAVPNKKYCERHIHRGRQRSRKLVEASQDSTTSISSTTGTSTNLSISLPVST